MLPVAILAGGLATRLRPHTDCVPKSLIRVAGKPFVLHQLELLRGAGIERVVLCVGHLGDQVEALVGDGQALGLRVSYSFDGDLLLGTGGALKKAIALLGEHFFALNGDSYLPCCLTNIASAYRASRRRALMTIFRNENRWDRSNVRMNGTGTIEYDKSTPRPDMAYIDFGLYVFSAGVFDDYPAARPVDLADICRRLSVQGELAAFEAFERFYEIGSASGLAETRDYLGRRPCRA